MVAFYLIVTEGALGVGFKLVYNYLALPIYFSQKVNLFSQIYFIIHQMFGTIIKE